MSFMTPVQGTPGWFDDPWTPGITRYWDGQQWTERSFGEPLPPPGSVPQMAFTTPRRGVATTVDGYAIAALVTGLLGICAGIVPIYLGTKAKDRIRYSGGTKNGEGLATAGQVLGSLWMAYFVISIVMAISHLGDAPPTVGP